MNELQVMIAEISSIQSILTNLGANAFCRDNFSIVNQFSGVRIYPNPGIGSQVPSDFSARLDLHECRMQQAIPIIPKGVKSRPELCKR